MPRPGTMAWESSGWATPPSPDHRQVEVTRYGANSLSLKRIGASDEVGLSVGAAHRALDTVIANIEVLLSLDRIHADLSAYNLLCWEGEVTLIGFPQVVAASRHPAAFDLLRRDVERACDYFSRYISGVNAPAIISRLAAGSTTGGMGGRGHPR